MTRACYFGTLMPMSAALAGALLSFIAERKNCAFRHDRARPGMLRYPCPLT
jgi:hypothetical protein